MNSGGPDECPVQHQARELFNLLNVHDGYLDRNYNRCFCDRCYPSGWPDTIDNDGPTAYIIPRGWVRFGLALPSRAKALDMLNKWSVSFHGVSSPMVLKSIPSGLWSTDETGGQAA